MKTLVRFPKPLILLVVAFLLAWAVLSGEFYPNWDATYYYAYTRSVVFDGDLKIDNDLLLSYDQATAPFANAGFDQNRTETGRVDSPFALGSSLIWLPWFSAIRGASIVGQWLDLLPEHLTGFEWFFTLPTSALSALLGLLAFWLGYLVAYPETSKSSGLVAILTLFFATPLIYYQFREPLYSHATSAFVNGLVVFLWWRSYRRAPAYKGALFLGAVIGLAALVRWQNIVYGILPLISALWWWLDLPPEERRHRWKRPVFYSALIGISALAVFSIQLSHWHLLYNSWFTIPQGGAYVDWSAPFLTPVLFSPLRGVLPWMPVAFLAVLGLILMGKRRPRLVFPLLFLLLITMYVHSSTRDWFGGGGYGPRRFTSELAIFIFGYSGLIEAIPRKIRKPTALILGFVLFIHQWILLRFGLAEGIGGRVTSLYPEYQWIEDTYAELITSFGGHLSDFIDSPRDTFVMFGSPLAQVIDGRWPGVQIVALFVAALFLLVIWLAFRLSSGRIQKAGVAFWPVTIIIALLILFADIWLLTWA